MARSRKNKPKPSPKPAPSAAATSGAETAPVTPAALGPPRKPLLALVGLGVASALWALFLWYQLLRARSGFDPFCAFGATDCGQLWDASFASWTHRFTGLPVAAWGLVWGVVAASLPLRALGEGGGRLLGAIRWTAAAGLAGVVMLLVVSAAEGLFCTSCALTYLFTGAYGAVALSGLGGRSIPWSTSQLGPALGTLALTWLILLYPGIRTPSSTAAMIENALHLPADPEGPSHRPHHASGDNPFADHPLRIPEWPLETEEQHARLTAYIDEMEPRLQQFLSDVLAGYRNAKAGPEVPARHLVGSPSATTRVVEFTDSKCGHCAELFANMKVFGQLFPEGAFALESRHFPLDGHCNPAFPVRGSDETRCVAAKARICLEEHEDFFAFEEAVYSNQEALTEDMVFDLAEPYMPRGSLRACIRDPQTEAALAQDVAYAQSFSPRGTPLVLVNGREYTAAGPFLYALILASGDPNHPAFEALPEPSPEPEERG
ncbi:MAG: thioredoxin domain-containing protein [Holophagales bacterium]|nr:thioredoxin domain-containing protein [Holophagales bacterium]